MIEHLYKVKIIRDFLSLYSDNKWKELITLALEYGILCLRRQHNIAALSIDDLEAINEEMKEEEKKRKKTKLSSPRVNERQGRSTISITDTRNNIRERDRATSEPGRDRADSAKASKPPSNWRTGDQIKYVKSVSPFVNHTRTKSNSESLYQTNTTIRKDIYPKWWGDVTKANINPNSNVKINKLKQRDNRRTEYRENQALMNTSSYSNIQEQQAYITAQPSEFVHQDNTTHQHLHTFENNYNTNVNPLKINTLSESASRVTTEYEDSSVYYDGDRKAYKQQNKGSDYFEYVKNKKINEENKKTAKKAKEKLARRRTDSKIRNQILQDKMNYNLIKHTSLKHEYNDKFGEQSHVREYYNPNQYQPNQSGLNNSHVSENSYFQHKENQMNRTNVSKNISSNNYNYQPEHSQNNKSNYQNYTQEVPVLYPQQAMNNTGIPQQRRDELHQPKEESKKTAQQHNNQANYVICFDKSLKPQVIKEKTKNNSKQQKQQKQANNQNSSQYPNPSTNNLDHSIRSKPQQYDNTCQDGSNLNKTYTSNLEDSSIQNHNYNYNSNSQFYNNEFPPNRSKQHIKNKFSSDTNYNNEQYDSNILSKRENRDLHNETNLKENALYNNFQQNSKYQNYHHKNANNNISQLDPRLNNCDSSGLIFRNNSDILSPHFTGGHGNQNAYDNNYDQYDHSRDEFLDEKTTGRANLSTNNNMSKLNLTGIKMNTVNEVSMNANDDKKPNVSFQKREEESENNSDSDKLSSYAPSERTKEIFKKHLKESLNDSKYSNQYIEQNTHLYQSTHHQNKKKKQFDNSKNDISLSQSLLSPNNEGNYDGYQSYEVYKNKQFDKIQANNAYNTQYKSEKYQKFEETQDSFADGNDSAMDIDNSFNKMRFNKKEHKP